VLLCLDQSAFVTADERHLTLGTVQGEGGPERGRCSLQLPHDYANKEGRYVFIADFSGHGVVNVDGADRHLELVKSEGGNVKERGDLANGHVIHMPATDLRLRSITL
jgi:hypothetical protein